SLRGSVRRSTTCRIGRFPRRASRQSRRQCSGNGGRSGPVASAESARAHDPPFSKSISGPSSSSRSTVVGRSAVVRFRLPRHRFDRELLFGGGPFEFAEPCWYFTDSNLVRPAVLRVTSTSEFPDAGRNSSFGSYQTHDTPL